WSSANAINNSGLIAGESILANGKVDAVLFRTNGIVQLGAIRTNGDYATALGINDSNIVVGYANAIITPGVQTNQYAYIYSNSVFTSIGTLGSGTYSIATAINNAGQVVGESSTAGGDVHAYLYSGGVMTDLGTLGGGTFSTATAINNLG